MARLYAGTSGWGYPEWRGSFYPAKLSSPEMLPYYAHHLSAVEVNNSFYRLPLPEAVAKWRDSVPPGFRFAVKAPRVITYRQRPQDAQQLVGQFFALANLLGEGRGPILCQLPPTMEADVGRLEALLDVLRPANAQLAVDIRHPSWLTDGVYDLLGRYGATLCLTETEDYTPPLLPAAGFAYVRLRKTAYTPDELKAWRDKLTRLVDDGHDVYCFLKHEAEFAVLAVSIFGSGEAP